MKRGNNATENLIGTRTHTSIDHWGLHDCFHREQVYKKPGTRHTKIYEAFITTRKELRNGRTLCAFFQSFVTPLPLFSTDLKKFPPQYLYVLKPREQYRKQFSVLLSLSLTLFLSTYGTFKKLLEQRP